MIKTVYLLGNILEKKDNLTLKIKPGLEKIFPEIHFLAFDPNEETETDIGPVFMDIVSGIDKVRVLRDLKNFRISPRNSVHDFDLPVFLGLMLKLGKIKSFKIIGIPEKYSKKRAITEVAREIKRI